MGAFFSGTDSADEVSTRVFGVIGEIKENSFSSVWRAGVNGQFQKLNLDAIWDDSDKDKTKWIIDPELVKERVSKLVYQTNIRNKPSVGNVANRGRPTWVNKQNKTDSVSAYNDWHYNGYYYNDGSDVSQIKHASNYNTVNTWQHVPEDVIIEFDALVDSLEETVQSEHLGECGSTELTSVVRAFMSFFNEFDAFNEKTAYAIFDQLQTDMKNELFQKALVAYANDYFDDHLED